MIFYVVRVASHVFSNTIANRRHLPNTATTKAIVVFFIVQVDSAVLVQIDRYTDSHLFNNHKHSTGRQVAW